MSCKTISSNFHAALFLLLCTISACSGNPTEKDLIQERFQTICGAYSGYYRIGNDTFFDMTVQVIQHGDFGVKVASESDLIRPFGCPIDLDQGLLFESTDLPGARLSFAVSDTEKTRMTILYEDTEAQYVGTALYF